MSITLIPPEQCKANYYLQDMVDGSLRLTYEVIRFCERFGNVQILSGKDIIDMRLFLAEPLSRLVERREELVHIIENGKIHSLGDIYTDMIMSHAISEVKKADYEVSSGQYILYCNEYMKNEGSEDNWHDYVGYFSPIEVVDSKELAVERLKELKRLIYVYSTDKYYTKVGIYQCVDNDDDYKGYNGERFINVHCDD